MAIRLKGLMSRIRPWRKQLGYLGIGNRRGMNGGQSWEQYIAALLSGAPVQIPLTHSIVPQRGTGITPTFTRATTETGQKWDEAGYLNFTALAGEMVFKGARREYNQWTTSSVSLANGANKSLTLAAGTYQFSMGAGTGTATFSGTGGATGTLGASASARVSVAKTISAGTFVVTASVADLADLQVCDITGETDQTTIRPYVSVGVESAPAYHGSMVDGVKCYDTDRSGNPITRTPTYDAVTLNGVAGTYVSTPDSVAASVTGDIDIRVKAALTDWTPAADNTLVSKHSAAGTQLSYAIVVDATTGNLRFYGSLNGLTLSITTVSTAATGFSDGATGWVRATRVSATGVINFYTSTDGVTWTQLGTANLAGSSGALKDSTSVLKVGQFYDAGTAIASGKIYQAQIYNGINGTLAVDFNASRYAGGTTLTGSTGETWTLQGNAVVHPTSYPLVGYVPWEARTNLCLQSNAFTTTWTASGTPAATQNVIGPDGGTSAWTLTDNSAVATEEIYQLIALTAATHTVSVFVKKTVGAQASYPVIQGNSGSTFALATIDTSNGVATAWTAYTANSIAAGLVASCTNHNDDYWRVQMSFTATAAGWFIHIVPAGSTVTTALNTVVDAAAQGSAVFYGAQVELGSFASTYIPTTTVAVARNADVLTYTGADVANIKTLATTSSIGYTSTSPHVIAGVSNNTTSVYSIHFIGSGNLDTAEGTTGGNQWTIQGSARVANAVTKLASTWATNDVKADKNGTALTPDTTATVPAATQLDVGHLAGTFVLNGPVNHIYGWTRNLSQSELGAVDR